MHMENAHTHPVVLSFISLVEAEIIEKKRAKKEQSVETIENGMYIVKSSILFLILYKEKLQKIARVDTTSLIPNRTI